MKEEVTARIQSLIDSMSCPKDFKCAEGGFETLCKAKDVGLKRHLVCLDDDPEACLFAMPMDDTYFCQCPLRVYIAKNLSR
jgi:hypothetical protein